MLDALIKRRLIVGGINRKLANLRIEIGKVGLPLGKLRDLARKNHAASNGVFRRLCGIAVIDMAGFFGIDGDRLSIIQPHRKRVVLVKMEWCAVKRRWSTTGANPVRELDRSTRFVVGVLSRNPI